MISFVFESLVVVRKTTLWSGSRHSPLTLGNACLILVSVAQFY